MRGALAPNVDVCVVGVDPARALGVRDARDRANERGMLHVREHDHVLPLLDVHSDPEGDPRVLVELRRASGPEGVGVHASTLPP